MIMKKIIRILVLFALSLIGYSVYADITLQSEADVNGSWKLQTSKNSLTDKNPITREDTWVFKDGQLTIMHIPREGKYYDQAPVKYEIEDGKIKIAILGTSRFELYTVVDKDDKNMTLKGKYGSYYYYTKN
jgi:hypothetical protein